MGKGTNTTTTQSGPSPAAMDAYNQLLARSSGVANTPYTPYGGELTAPVNAQQTTGINNINQNAGFAQPFIQQASDFATQAAQPLTEQQIQQYQSPYTQNVVDATTNWFNQQNKQQQQNVVGNAAAQGALGGDRVGVAQANLASQQTASQAPIIAGLYDKSYQQALGVAQQQQQNRGNAAYSLGNLGVAGQNAALTGANAQVGAGTLQQQNEQQRLNALYQQFQIAQAFPYQQTQWLAGIDTGVGSQMGGTSSTTAPPPNPWAQYAGVGLAAAGMFLNRGGRIRGFAPGGSVDEAPYAGVGWIPGRQITMGRGAPPPPNVPGTAPPVDTTKAGLAFAQKAMRSGDNTSGPSLSWEDFTRTPVGGFAPVGASPELGFGMGPIYANGGRIPGFAPGGTVDDLSFNDRFAPAIEAIRSGDFDPQGINYTTGEPKMGVAADVPIPRPRPDDAPVTAGLESPQQDDANVPLGFMPGERPLVDQPLAYGPGALQSPAATPAAAAPDRRSFGLGMIPADLKMPLLAAGLGMLASRSPNLGNAIGEGGLAGVGTYAQQKQADLQHQEKQTALSQTNRRIDLEAKRLDQAAEQARKHLELQTAQFGETKAQHAIAAMKPETIGMTPSGLEIKGVRDPATQSYRIIDPTTGRLLPLGEGIPGAKPAGSTYIDPQSGKPITGTQASADGVIPANAQLVSSGTPYDYSTDSPYIEKGMDVPKPAPVSGKSTNTVQTDAEYYLQTGKLPPAARGRNPAAIQMNNYRNAVQNYATSLATSRGISPEQTAEMWRTAPGMLRFVLGADGRSTVALGTAVRHLDTVQELAKAWAANDTQAINRIRAMISRQFGNDAATNLEAAGRIVGPEIIKALGVAGAGTEGDRNTAAAQFSAATSPAQLKGAVDTVQKLLGGQLEGRKRQAANAGVSEERFKNLIGDRPYEILSGLERGAHTAPTVGPQDKAALEWANANPSDPRAAAIKKRLGVP